MLCQNLSVGGKLRNRRLPTQTETTATTSDEEGKNMQHANTADMTEPEI